MQLVLDNNGIVLKKRNHSFWVVHKKGSRMISPHKISSIAVVDDCLISTAAIKLAAANDVPIYFFTNAGKLAARLWSPSFGSIATIRRKQVLFAEKEAASSWIMDVFALKMQEQHQVLHRISKLQTKRQPMVKEAISQMKKTFDKANPLRTQKLDACRNQFLGIEGAMAKIYWQEVAQSLPEVYRFKERSRRPAKDAFNAVLNYLYGMLYGIVTQATVDAGLDTHLGILHLDEYSRPTFTFDLIEPFRPWVDALLLEIFIKEGVDHLFFKPHQSGIHLSKQGKRFFIPRFNDMLEERIVFDHKRLSRKNHIFRFAGLFAQKLLNEE